MAIKIEFLYDEDKNIIFFTDIADLKTEEDVDEFIKIYNESLGKVTRRVYAVSNINELKIHPDIAEYYGEKIKPMIADYFQGHVRYATDYQARVMLRNAYLRARIPAHIYDTKEEALQAIEAMKKKE